MRVYPRDHLAVDMHVIPVPSGNIRALTMRIRRSTRRSIDRKPGKAAPELTPEDIARAEAPPEAELAEAMADAKRLVVTLSAEVAWQYTRLNRLVAQLRSSDDPDARRAAAAEARSAVHLVRDFMARLRVARGALDEVRGVERSFKDEAQRARVCKENHERRHLPALAARLRARAELLATLLVDIGEPSGEQPDDAGPANDVPTDA